MSAGKRKILVDINHPAHVHFFKHPLARLAAEGHQLLVTARDRQLVPELLDALELEYRLISKQNNNGLLSLAGELAVRDYRLYRVAKQFRPDVMAAVGGTCVAHVGWLTGIKSLVFYDTEIARLQNLITYPFCSLLHVPCCYRGRVPVHKTVRYRGYHELSYLHPSVFTPSKDTAIANGVLPVVKNIFIRLVSWRASHDIGHDGISIDKLRELAMQLSRRGNVIISSEKPLPAEFGDLAYHGRADAVHHVLAFCDAFVGESATMATESAVLGVPALYIADSYRSYVDDIETRYGLITDMHNQGVPGIAANTGKLLERDKSHWQKSRARLLSECINVPEYVAECILDA